MLYRFFFSSVFVHTGNNMLYGVKIYYTCGNDKQRSARSRWARASDTVNSTVVRYKLAFWLNGYASFERGHSGMATKRCCGAAAAAADGDCTNTRDAFFKTRAADDINKWLARDSFF